MRRLAPRFLSVLAVLYPFVLSLSAQQSCPPPVIVLSGGSNPACAGTPVTLDAGDGWASYRWSTGATTRTITDSPAQQTSYWVTTTDANECSATSQTYTVNVNPSPSVTVSPTSDPICTGGSVQAVAPMADGATYSWTVTNGTIVGSAANNRVDLTAGVAGTMTATVTMTDANGCTATASYAFTVTTIPPPSISAPSSACPGSTLMAETPMWYSAYQWSITGGTLNPPDVNGGPNTNRVYFVPDGSGPVTLTVAVAPSIGCGSVSNSVTIPLNAFVPTIRLNQSPICPLGSDSADVSAGGVTMSTYQWAIANGIFDGPSNGPSVMFHGDGSGQAIALSVNVTDTTGACGSASATVTVANTLGPLTIQLSPEAVCATGSGYGYLSPPPQNGWRSINWSATNGVIVSSDAGGEAQFRGDGSGRPVGLTADVVDNNGCTARVSATVPVKTIPPPLIYTSSAVCANSSEWANVSAPTTGGSWASVNWSIVNGVVESTDSYGGVTYHADGNGPVTLSAAVTDTGGCSASSSTTVALSAITPALSVQYASAPANATNSAWVARPASGSYTVYAWSIVNGAIDGANDGPDVQFHADGSGAVTLTLTVTTDRGCSGSSSVNVPLSTLSLPRIQLMYPSSCAGTSNGASISSPAGGWASIQWSITHGTITSASYSTDVYFTTDGSAPATLSVTVTDSANNSGTSSVLLPIAVAPPIRTFNATTCSGAYTSVGIDPVYGTFYGYSWSVTNARLISWPGDQIANFYPDGTGPVTVSVTLRDSGGCTLTSSTVLPLRSVDPPVMTLSDPMPYPGSGWARIEDPNSLYTQFDWSALRASIAIYGTDQHEVTIYPDGSGPVTLWCTVHTYDGCTATVTREVLLQGNSLMIDAQPRFCGPVTSTASLFPNSGLTNIQWSIGNGTIVSGGNEYTVTYHVNGNADATLSATARDAAGNTLTATKVVTYTPLSISLQGGSYYCPQYYSQFNVNNSDYTLGSLAVAASDNANVSIINATRFAAKAIDPAKPMTITITATTIDGCQASATITQQSIDVAYKPDITLDRTAFCDTTGQAHATITNAQPNTSYHWSIVNGVLDSYDYATSVTFHPTGTSPITLNLSVWPYNSACNTYASLTIPVGAPPTPAVTASGPTTFCTGGNVTLTAPSGYSYTWSNGATTRSITVSAAGSYTVTVRDTNGCTATSAATPVSVTAPPAATIAASGPTTFCAGGNVTLTAPSGYSYSWSNGASTQSIGVSASGSFTVTVTDANGCSATSAATAVTVRDLPPQPVITPSGPTAICDGSSINLTAPAGYSYRWSTGATTQSIFVNDVGTFTVTVTDAFGCSAQSAAVSTTLIPRPSSGITYDPQPVNPANQWCGGTTVTLTASGSASYLWSTGETTQSIRVSAKGTYTCVLTGANGCTTTTSAFINILDTPKPVISGASAGCQPVRLSATNTGANRYYWQERDRGILSPQGLDPLQMDILQTGDYQVVAEYDQCTIVSDFYHVEIYPDPAVSVGTAYMCPGGSATLTAAGTNLPTGTTFLWSTGETTPSITVTAPGQYNVTTTSPAGCTYTASGWVYARSVTTPTITAGGPTTFCQGGSVRLTASAGASYLWSNGATTQSITVSASNNYHVSVTDSNGCTATSADTTVLVNATPPVPVVTPSGATTFCAGGNVTLTAPSGYSYSWSNGAATQAITVSASGSYSVTVTDANGCGATSAPIAVTVYDAPPAPAITASGPTSFCSGGSVTLTAPAGTTYSWSNGATTQAINVTSSGSFSVTLSNANGCTATSSPVTVTVSPSPSATISASGPTTFCSGGSVTLTASNGASYSWSNGATTQAVTVSTSGSYSVTVTGANGCSTTSAAAAVTVNANPPTPTISASGPTTFCAGGSVTLTAPAGYAYSWSNGATTQAITVSASGSYSVTVRNASGCAATSSATAVTANANPPVPVLTPSGSTTFCAGGNVTLTAPSGYSYSWSNGAATQAITVSSSGSYSVTVTDANGCGATSAATAVTVNATPPTPTITAVGPTTFCSGSSVALRGPDGYSYSWSNGATTQSITVSASGSYSVTVTDAHGCSATSAATSVTVLATPPAPVITASGPTSFCPGGSVTLTAPAGYSYLWYTGATTQSISATTSGQYWVKVTNADGCSATSAITQVTVNSNPPVPVVSANQTAFCPGGSATLSGPGGYSYLWSTGETTSSIAVGSAGSYTLTVTDSHGCSSTSAPVAISVYPAPPTPTIAASGPTTFCAGGSVTLTAPSGYTYWWGPIGATTQSITVNSSGSYYVIVRDGNGCSATSASTAVTVQPLPTSGISVAGPTTFCQGGTTILLAYDAQSYRWSTGETTKTIGVTTSGTYFVTITDANGCSAMSPAVTITVNPLPPTPAITASGPTTFCNGGSVTLTAPAGYTYSWSNGAGTRSIVAADSGSYSVTVTDANGCSATSAATVVTENPTINAFGPTSQSVAKNATPQNITVTATGPTLKYQWYKGQSGNTAQKANSTSYSFKPPTGTVGTFYYWVRITSGTCTADSPTATVIVQ